MFRGAYKTYAIFQIHAYFNNNPFFEQKKLMF